MALTAKDITRIDERVELGVRRYFDKYLEDVFPEQLRALLDAHDQSCLAHGGVAKRLDRLRFLAMGFAAAGGFGGGLGLAKLVHLV
jgi:hypothetical protein